MQNLLNYFCMNKGKNDLKKIKKLIFKLVLCNGNEFVLFVCYCLLTWCHWSRRSALAQCSLSWPSRYSGQFLFLCLPSSPHCLAVLLLEAPSPWEQRGTYPHRDRVSQREWWKLELRDVLQHTGIRYYFLMFCGHFETSTCHLHT